MQKLLIVLAIQFCLPLVAELLHRVVEASVWGLPVVVVHAVCSGCALVLMWPRWRWMLLTSLLAGIFWPIWLQVYLFSRADFFAERPQFDFTSVYYSDVMKSALLSCFMTLVFCYHRRLIWQRIFAGDVRPRFVWQFTSRTFLYYSGCAALIVGAAVGLYDAEAGDILGLTLGDLCLVGMSLIMFLHLLQRSINWLSLGACTILIGVLFFKSYDGTILSIVALQERIVFLGSFLGFCTLTVGLYRWAGFRIVPRSDLALNLQPTGQH